MPPEYDASEGRARRGLALLEVLLGIALLGSAGLGVVLALRHASVAEAAAGEEERRLGAADRVLAAMTLLRRRELDQRIGARRVGRFVVLVERPEPMLYRIALRDSSAPGRELLTTVVYRPAAGDP